MIDCLLWDMLKSELPLHLTINLENINENLSFLTLNVMKYNDKGISKDKNRDNHKNYSLKVKKYHTTIWNPLQCLPFPTNMQHFLTVKNGITITYAGIVCVW